MFCFFLAVTGTHHCKTKRSNAVKRTGDGRILVLRQAVTALVCVVCHGLRGVGRCHSGLHVSRGVLGQPNKAISSHQRPPAMPLSALLMERSTCDVQSLLQKSTPVTNAAPQLQGCSSHERENHFTMYAVWLLFWKLTCSARLIASKSCPCARYARVPDVYAANSMFAAPMAFSGEFGSSLRAALDADTARSTAADCSAE